MKKCTYKKTVALAFITCICSACNQSTNYENSTTAIANHNEQTDTNNTKQITKDAMNIQTTESGLQYIVLKEAEATAEQPHVGAMVHVHYTGWLYNEQATENKGKKFDSSHDRGTPLQFIVGVGQVIKGWDEALLDMKVGESRRLIIPAHLAYGSHAVGNLIPASATLVFDVELISIS